MNKFNDKPVTAAQFIGKVEEAMSYRPTDVSVEEVAGLPGEVGSVVRFFYMEDKPGEQWNLYTTDAALLEQARGIVGRP